MATAELARKHCKPCSGEVDRLKGAELKRYIAELPQGWSVIDDHHLEKQYKVEKYQGAIDFANAVAKIADQEDHHPEICFTWGKVTITIWTHKVDGLTENDFILAAKAEEAYKKMAIQSEKR